MRARNIKPKFFRNYDLCTCQPLSRLLFAGLWCVADREGRLEYRPEELKADIFPYDKVEITKLLKELSEKGFIAIYNVNSNTYLQVNNFKKHQNPHCKEPESTIPAPCEYGASTVQEQFLYGSRPADSPSLIPDSLKLSTEHQDMGKTEAEISRYANLLLERGWNHVYSWIGKCRKENKHPEAMLRCIKSLYDNNPPGNKWAYVTAAMKVENQNSNERQRIKKHEELKKEESETIDIKSIITQQFN